jgi:hypothetical protein
MLCTHTVACHKRPQRCFSVLLGSNAEHRDEQIVIEDHLCRFGACG